MMAGSMEERLARLAEAVRKRRGVSEQTTSANAGGFAVPLGPPLQAVFPTSVRKKRKRRPS